jgi:Mrp family chromosome partitioning ATPase
VADLVIIDTPPVLAVADASILAGLADGAIFLVDGQNTRRSAIAQSRSQLETAGATIIGVVYNNYDPSQSHAYPYHYYGYQHYYANGAASNVPQPAKSRLSVLRGRKSAPAPIFQDRVGSSN